MRSGFAEINFNNTLPTTKKIYYLNKSDGITDGNPLEWIDPLLFNM